MVRNARRPAAHRMPAMRAPTETGRRAPCRAAETPTQRLDRLVHASTAPLTGGLSPISLALAWADWAWHLAVSPGRQMELAALGAQTCADALRDALPGDGPQAAAAPVGLADDDPRFRHPAWAQWPFSAWRAGFRQAELFWQQAAATPGMTAHHADMTRFFARQWLGACAPANHLWTNPVVLADARDSAGAHLVQGAVNWLRDLTGTPDPSPRRRARSWPATPGRADPLRAADRPVHPEPVLIVPVVDHEVLHPRPVAAQLAGALPGRPGPHGLHAVLAQPRPGRRTS
jgi:polyhydroxyalkanoate synthase